jgi:Glycosyltransferase Family 4
MTAPAAAGPRKALRPTAERRTIGSLSDRIVVMSARAAHILRKVYGVAPGRIEIIPHGVPDTPFLDSSYHKEEYGMIGKKVILTAI